MFTPEAEQLYRETVEYSKVTGLTYSAALKAVLEEKKREPGQSPATVLEASTRLDAEIHRLMTEEQCADYSEGMHRVLNSADPRHVAIARAYLKF